MPADTDCFISLIFTILEQPPFPLLGGKFMVQYLTRCRTEFGVTLSLQQASLGYLQVERKKIMLNIEPLRSTH